MLSRREHEIYSTDYHRLLEITIYRLGHMSGYNCGYQIQISSADLHITILLCILSEQSGHIFTEVFALRPLYIHSLKVRIITGKF